MPAPSDADECILNGATRMRTQVEVDPGYRLARLRSGAVADRRLPWAIDIEICVFPQDGLTNYPGTEELLVTALKRGARVMGGAPRYDSDHSGQIRRIFELAREFDADIDIHLDVGDTPEAHGCALGLRADREVPPRRPGRGRPYGETVDDAAGELAAMARRLADTGVAVTVLPLTDLFVMGRDRDHDVRRGVADANFLVEHGVNCSLSTNNVLNPVTPYGDCSLIRMANLHANVLQIGRPAQLREFCDADRAPARLLNLKDYGLAVGNPADIVVIDAATPEQAVAEIRPPLAVWKRGRRTVTRHPPELLRPAGSRGPHLLLVANMHRRFAHGSVAQSLSSYGEIGWLSRASRMARARVCS